MSEQTEGQPSPEEMRKAGQVSQAVAQAAADAPTAEQARTQAEAAARQTAERVNLELTDENIRAIVDTLVDALETRGAFDAPVEPVTPPPPPAPAGGAVAPVENPAAAAQPDAPAPPRKRTFAQRFLGE